MKTFKFQTSRLMAMLTLVMLLAVTQLVHAEIHGITGPSFTLTASAANIDTPDGDSVLMWGYGVTGSPFGMQYPGPTLIVNQGETVNITLTNSLSTSVSMVFPGQTGVTSTGGSAGLLTNEAAPSGSVTYQFTATNAGTYMYHSGTDPQLQIEMGLVGALIVRPPQANQAYSHADTAYDQEYLFLLTALDLDIHLAIEQGRPQDIDNTAYNSVHWFINGRNGPDTMSPPNLPWQPHQPYNALARTHPGDKVLIRVIGASRETHPFHTHGNHFFQIARDGRLLESTPGAGPDRQRGDFTLQTVPGATYDALWEWTGENLGWDIYGTPAEGGTAHTCIDNLPGPPAGPDGFDDTTHEYCADHGKTLGGTIGVSLPENQDLTFGGFYSGSPFLGVSADLPPGEGGLNVNGGLFFMWHSHNAKEQVNNDLFPGGMTTMMVIEPPGVAIP